MARRPGGEPQPSADVVNPKVIYVMGAGRSGSTILGVALGNCAGVFFAGELDRWLVRSGLPSPERADVSRFWQTIREQMGEQSGLFGGKTTSLERSSALLDIRKWRRRRRLRPRYRDACERLYRVLARARQVTHIVDTSHYPLRARELQSLAGIDLYLLYLMRDPHSVVASLGRRDVPERTFAMLTANAYLWLTHALSVLVFLRHPRRRRLFVRYEDFVRNPEHVLRQILDHCDCGAPLPDLAELHTGVPFHGNRLIESETVTLSHRSSPSAHRASLTQLIQLPWTVIAWWLRPAAGSR